MEEFLSESFQIDGACTVAWSVERMKCDAGNPAPIEVRIEESRDKVSWLGARRSLMPGPDDRGVLDSKDAPLRWLRIRASLPPGHGTGPGDITFRVSVRPRPSAGPAGEA